MKTTLYFAYGSNLDPAQMRRRCPHAAPLGKGVLRGYRLAFGGHSRAWGGPVATVVKEPDDWVEGVLYALPRAELALLDRFEGATEHGAPVERRAQGGSTARKASSFAYRRKLLLVTDETGRRRRAYVYVLPVAEEAPPAPDYLGVLWRAYQRLGFDQGPLVTARGGVR